MSSYLGSKKIKQIFLTDSKDSQGKIKIKRVLKLALGDKIVFSDWKLSYNDSSDNNPPSYTITGHSNPVGDLVIPSYKVTDGVHDDYFITKIGDGAFENCTSLTSITLNNNITDIGNNAFKNCSSLTSIALPDSVTSIGNSVLKDCSNLTSVTIGNGVISIGNYAFSSCFSLTSIAIPSSVTSMGEGAFYDCRGLTSITIPNSVTSIEDTTFFNCLGLTSIVIPNSITSIGYGAFLYCSSLTNITIPDSVTSIGARAFEGCEGLTSITIDNGVTNIGSEAFYDCRSLKGITVPSSVTSIGNSAFSGCSSLQSITIPFVGNRSGVTSNHRYQYPFGYIFGTSSYTGGTKTTQYYIGYEVDEDKLTNTTYYIPSSLRTVKVTGGNILAGAFWNCQKLKTVNLEQTNITKIEYAAFFSCYNLTNISFPNTLITIGRLSFQNCTSISYLTLPENLKIIDIGAFYDCTKLKDLNFPNTLTTIGSAAFGDCKGFVNIIIPDSVISIGASIFEGCTNLESLSLPYIGNRPNVTTGKTYQYPFGYLFGTSPLTGTLAQQEYHKESLRDTTITNFYIPNKLYKVTIRRGNLLQGAFQNCTTITELELQEGIDYIYPGSLYGCYGLEKLTIPFVGRSKHDLTGYYYPFGDMFGEGTKRFPVNSSGDPTDKVITQKYVYKTTSSTTYYENQYCIPLWLEEITIRNNNTTSSISIPDYAFINCSVTEDEVGTSFKPYSEFYILGNIEVIGEHAFENCSNMEKLTITDQIKQIKAYAFFNYTKKDYMYSISLYGDNIGKDGIGTGAFSNRNAAIYVNFSYSSNKSSNYSNSFAGNTVVFYSNLNNDGSGDVNYITKSSNSIQSFNRTGTDNTTVVYVKDNVYDSPHQFWGSSTKWKLNNTGDGITPDKLDDSDQSVGPYYPVKSSCITNDSLITLANKQIKRVDELTENDELLIWDFEKGLFDSSQTLFIDKEMESLYEIYKLTFSDKTEVKIIYEHGFFDKDLNKFIYLRKDADKYIGHRFLKEELNDNNELILKEVTLDRVEILQEKTTPYSPVTKKHLGYFVNGMLTMPGGIEGLFNIFNIDPTTLAYNKEEKANDINTYGNFTYEEFNSNLPISQSTFEALNGEYLKVALGKKLITEDFIKYLYDRYSPLFPKEDE